MFTVYGKPNCVNCDKVKTLLNAADLEYLYIDVTQDQNSFDFLMSKGLKSLPQVWDKQGNHYQDVESVREAVFELM